MARKKSPERVITEVKPHTIKKFELIERYVDEWARKILGYNGKGKLSGSKGVVFIDCMCNSGIYEDENGNLIEGTALRITRLINKIMYNYPQKRAILYFNDISSERTAKLKEILAKEDCSCVTIYISTDDCNRFLKTLNLGRYRAYNILMMYDPYKAEIDWDAVSPFLNTWGEVIINHMVSDTVRGASLAKREEVKEKYEKTYQQKIIDIIQIANDRDALNEIIFDIIKEQSNRSYKELFIASFPFFNRNNGVVYNLIHCSKNIEGIKLFKKVAWKTFGGRSSLKETHGKLQQIGMDFDRGCYYTKTDDKCYYVQDIAKYIYSRYHAQGEISLDYVYDDLDRHPIFPSDGFKNEIKNELRNVYGAQFPKGKNTLVFNK